MAKVDDAMRDFAKRWTLDGDYLRCRNCNRPQITSRADEHFKHDPDCSWYDTSEGRPWLALLEILESLKQPEGWQTIESAPKDGTRVLLGRAASPGWPEEVVSGYYTARWNEWLTVGGGSMTGPTHWQPLAAAPKPQTGGQ